MGEYLIKKTFNSALLFFGLLCCSTATWAEGDYQFDVQGLYSSSNGDFGDVSLDMQSIAIGGNLYLNPISYTKGPYAEAAFFDRSPSLALAYGTEDVDLAFPGQTVPIALDGDLMIAGFNYMDNSHPFAFGLLTSSIDVDTSLFGTTIKFSIDTTSYSVGYFLNDHSVIALSKKNEEIKVRAGGSALTLGERNTLSVDYKTVNSLGGDRFANLEVSVASIKSDDDPDTLKNTEFGIAGDYYMDRMSGIGASVIYNSGDDLGDEGYTIELRGRKFVNKLTSLELSYEKFSGDEPDNEETIIAVLASFRFQ